MRHVRARRRTAWILGLFAAGCGTGLLAPPPVLQAASPGAAGDGLLNGQLDAIRGRHRLPALAGLTFTTEDVVESGVAGVRALGAAEAATPDDLWHIGSLTKSMTATLAARLVEQGKVAWDTRLGEAFPGLPMRPEYASVRLDELLTHTAGLVTDITRAPSWSALRGSRSPLVEQRRRLVVELLAFPPETARGTYSYSNAGYVVAGAVLEAVAAAAWEDLLVWEVLGPLGMTRTGFGAPGTPGRRDQPWGHSVSGDGIRPIAPSADADNPAAHGPAGTVHASLADLAAYYRLHLRGALGTASLLSASSFGTLHRPPPGSEYAFGWGVLDRSWGGGTVLTHSGSNTLWYAVVWLAPSRGFGVLAVTNAGGDAARRATDEAVALLISRHLAGRSE